MAYSSSHTIKTVIARELGVLMRSKGTMISLIIMVLAPALIMGGIKIFDSTHHDDSREAPKVAVVNLGDKDFEGTGLTVVGKPDRDAAVKAVEDKDVKAAVIASNEGWEVVSKDSPGGVSAAVDAAAKSKANAAALQAIGADQNAFAQAYHPIDIKNTDIMEEKHSDEQGASIGITIGAIFVMMMTVIMFAANVASRVSEEKSSRIVEIILAAVRPLDLLAGKVLSSTLFALGIAVAWIGVSLGAAATTGYIHSFHVSVGLVSVLLLNLLLAVLFFSATFAAAGSLVQRTEDLQSSLQPVMLLVMIVMYVPLIGTSSMDATWMKVLAWIPPFSVSVAPLEYAAGNMGAGAVFAAMVLMTLATAGALVLVARIYKNAILYNGSKLSWRKALTMASA